MADENFKMNEDCDMDCDNCDSCEGCEGCESIDKDSIVTLVDEETGESFEFAIVDEFDFNDKKYCVLITLDQEPEMVICEECENEAGEIEVLSLSEDEEDAIYDYYDSLFDDEDDEDDAEE